MYMIKTEFDPMKTMQYGQRNLYLNVFPLVNLMPHIHLRRYLEE